MLRVGFLINPIAGMGGRVGLKGTDHVVEEAIKRGAKPVAEMRARLFFEKLRSSLERKLNIEILTCSGRMGADILSEYKDMFHKVRTVYKTPNNTKSIDTKKSVEIFNRENVELIVFCGGDGTARDIYEKNGDKIPVLGIPSGVKMYSGVFSTKPESAAEILIDFESGIIDFADTEIMDMDEEAYRKGEWVVKLYGICKTLAEPQYIQGGKMIFDQIRDDEIKDEIAYDIIMQMKRNRDALYILGCGSTVDRIGEKLGLNTTVLGIDLISDLKLIKKDANERDILDIIDNYPKKKIIVSPIGAQGFIFGRGNQQISPDIIRKTGIDNIIIISTPSKLQKTPVLRVDTGDRELDRKIAEKSSVSVITGFQTIKLHPISYK